MNEYTQLLRDLIHYEPRRGFDTVQDILIDDEQLSIVLEHEPSILADAIVGHEDAFRDLLHNPTREVRDLYCSLVIAWTRAQAKRYLLPELRAMTETVEAEERSRTKYDHKLEAV